MKFGSIRDLGNKLPKFRELWSWGPEIPRGDVHQSAVTDALVYV